MPAANQACPACGGNRVVPNARTGEPCVCPLCEGAGQVEAPVERRPFFYVLAPAALAASQRLPTALNLLSRADFEWIWAMATSTGTFTTEMRDNAGREAQNAAVNNANQWGTAQLPFAFIVPWLLAASSVLNFVLTDTSVAPNTIQLVLGGYELYPVRG